MNRSRSIVCASVLLLLVSAVSAADKNGVSPQAVNLPSGPGSVQGLGESYQPNPSTGTGRYRLPIAVPRAAASVAPELTLQYDSGFPNGVLGMGWRLVGAPAMERSVDEGIPLYVDAPNGVDDDLDGVIDEPDEVDRITGVDGEEIVPLADGTLRAESEGGFLRYERDRRGFIVRSPSGRTREFGVSGASRWGRPTSFFEVRFTYEGGRPDVLTDYRSGFEITTALRLVRIEVIAQGIPAPASAAVGDRNGDGRVDALIRSYRLDYLPGASHSLLSAVTQFGRDGTTALPVTRFEYTSWSPS